MHLHRLARAYHTDPWSVLQWDALRMAVNTACLEQADAARSERIRRADGLMGVVDLAGDW